MYKYGKIKIKIIKTYDDICKAHNDIKNANALEMYKKYLSKKEENNNDR